MSLLSNKAVRHRIFAVGVVALQLHLLFAELCHGQELRIPHLVLARLEAADETGAFLTYHGLPLRGFSGKFQKGAPSRSLPLHQLIHALSRVVA